MAWRYHTGWPTTEISLLAVEDEEGEIEYEPVLGRFNDERLPDYHRFDLRASREWQLSFGELTFFVDIQNLFDRTNIAGFDIEIDPEEGELNQIAEPGLGFLPSVGFSIQF